MSNGNSPKDPAFFFHHNMVDKIWADWHEENGESSNDFYVRDNLPLYTDVDPDDVVDPRSLGIFYAANGLATLDKYTVSNTFTDSEKYGYQFDIEAKDNFIIPSGKDAEFRSCSEVLLSPGFTADLGASFFARIDGDCNFSTNGFDGEEEEQLLSRAKEEKPELEDQTSELKLRNYPNPFSQATNFEIKLQEPSIVSLEVMDLSGRMITTVVNQEKLEAGVHHFAFNANNLQAGIYLYRLSTNKETITQKMMLSK